MEKIIIVAMATNRVIGRDNKLPWRIPEDLQMFKEATMGYPMIMGRKTFESIGKPLPGRRHIVLSRNPDFVVEGAEYAPSLEEAYRLCGDAEKVFIIGGAQIFELALGSTDTVLLTLLEREVEGDIFFPEFPDHRFQEIHRQRYPNASEPFTVITYQRKESA